MRAVQIAVVEYQSVLDPFRLKLQGVVPPVVRPLRSVSATLNLVEATLVSWTIGQAGARAPKSAVEVLQLVHVQ